MVTVHNAQKAEVTGELGVVWSADHAKLTNSDHVKVGYAHVGKVELYKKGPMRNP